MADDLAVEAVAPDGVIEAVRLIDDPTFTVGVQWHAEWEPRSHELSLRLFEAFGEACRQHQASPVKSSGQKLQQVAS